MSPTELSHYFFIWFGFVGIFMGSSDLADGDCFFIFLISSFLRLLARVSISRELRGFRLVDIHRSVPFWFAFSFFLLFHHRRFFSPPLRFPIRGAWWWQDASAFSPLAPPLGATPQTFVICELSCASRYRPLLWFLSARLPITHCMSFLISLDERRANLRQRRFEE